MRLTKKLGPLTFGPLGVEWAPIAKLLVPKKKNRRRLFRVKEES